MIGLGNILLLKINQYVFKWDMELDCIAYVDIVQICTVIRAPVKLLIQALITNVCVPLTQDAHIRHIQ